MRTPPAGYEPCVYTRRWAFVEFTDGYEMQDDSAKKRRRRNRQDDKIHRTDYRII
jgi:hypothetical protein